MPPRTNDTSSKRSTATGSDGSGPVSDLWLSPGAGGSVTAAATLPDLPSAPSLRLATIVGLVVTTLGLAGALALILANAFFVAVEFALVAVDRSQMEVAAADGDERAGMVVRSLEQLSLHLSGVQLGITIASVVLGVVAEPTVARVIRPPLESFLSVSAARTISVIAALALATVVQMVVGELVPKAVAVARPAETATALAVPTRIFIRLFKPLIRLFGGVADRAVRRLGFEPKEELQTVRSRPELVRLVRTSSVEGTLDPTEASLLTRVFAFGEKTAADILTPRPDVVALPSDASGARLIEISRSTGFSRFPVIGTGVDDIVGIVHIKSLLDVPVERRGTVSIEELMVEPFVVPESSDLDRLLIEMRDRATYLVVVLDEYGGTAGIATLEDLLEEIVGEIDDEHDRRVPSVLTLGRTRLVPGGLHHDEVVEACGFEMPDGEYETLAGFVLDQLGHIPRVGESLRLEGWRFTVVRMDRRRVEMIQVEAPEPTSGVDSSDSSGSGRGSPAADHADAEGADADDTNDGVGP